eukprot:9947857-Heterocapsa_arctica.AAC.1
MERVCRTAGNAEHGGPPHARHCANYQRGRGQRAFRQDPAADVGALWLDGDPLRAGQPWDLDVPLPPAMAHHHGQQCGLLHGGTHHSSTS